MIQIQWLVNLFHRAGFRAVVAAPPAPPAPKHKEQVILTPNRQANYGNKCQYLVLHHTDGWAKDGNKGMGDISVCLDDKRDNRVSYHCIVAWDGTRTILAQDPDRAWHAGDSYWMGKTDCNNFTLGLAFGGNTNTGTMRPMQSRLLTKPELESALEYILPRMKKYGWSVKNIITHEMIAPTRKSDTSKDVLYQVRDAVTAALSV